MDYSKLVDVYEQLNKTTKRLEKTYIISEFLKDVSLDDMEHVMLLLEGRIFPNYDAREIGVASRLMLKSLSAATGIGIYKIEDEWKKHGDLGLVAESIVKTKKQATLHSAKLTVKKVFDNLRKLSGLQGQGTVERKTQLIAELLTSAMPAESKYIVKTILGEMRIGVGEGAMRDAIVWAFFGEKIGIMYSKEQEKGQNGIEKNGAEIENREAYNKYASAVQNAYDVTNEFAIVAKAAKSNGIKGLQNIEMKVGIPIQVMLALKADTIEEAFETVGRPAAIEFKYDGFRCITGYTPIYANWKGILSVKDVKIGDKVLTHTGRFRKVIAINKRHIDRDERLYSIQTFLGNEFRITENHPVLVSKDNKFLWVPIEKIKKQDELCFPIPKISVKSVLKDNLKLNDESGYKKVIPINKFFFRFLGYWIGDGYTNEFHNTERVGIIFNQKKDKRLCRYYKKNIIKNFKLNNLSENIHNGAIYLYWRDKPFRIWISENFRREWKGKMLPLWFYGISKTHFDEFLRGWIESDGYEDELGRISITTKERDLAMFGQLLGLKFKKIIGVKKVRINNATYYKLIIPKTTKKSRIVKNYLLLKILRLQEIQRPDPRTSLYNIQVEKDESYCTSMAILHNCQIHKKDNEIKIFTRRLEEVTNQFPDVAESVRKNIRGKSFIIDSEAVGYDKKTGKYLPFQNISQRIKRKHDIKKMSEDFPVELNIFDIIYYDGKSMINEEFEKRRNLLETVVKQEQKKITLSKSRLISENKDVEKFFRESVNSGNEGLMFKSLNAPYKPGARVGYMVKFKQIMETLDLAIVGAEWGDGKRSKWLSSYTLACVDENKNFAEVGKASTGLKEKPEEGLSFEEMSNLLNPLIISEKGKEVKVKPAVVIEVGYEEIQKSPTYSSGFALRFPRIIKKRDDKGPDEASSLEYVKKIYAQQKKG